MADDYALAFPTPEIQAEAIANLATNVGFGGDKPWDPRQFFQCPFHGHVPGRDLPYEHARELVTAANEERTARRRLEHPSPVSEAEVVLLAALLFYRENPVLQHPVGRYDLDFLIADYNAAIEVDGLHHQTRDRRRRDARRDAYVLNHAGLNTYRVPARDALKDPLWAVRYTCRQIILEANHGSRRTPCRTS